MLVRIARPLPSQQRDCRLFGWSKRQVSEVHRYPKAVTLTCPEYYVILLEQTEWIADHLKEMCLMAPPGFLNITIFVTSKRKSGEPPIMAGYVTHDRRNKVEEQISEQEKQTRSKPDSDASTPVERVQHESRVELRSGRPDFGELLQREMDHSAYTE